MKQIDPAKVAKRYNSLSVILENDDKWHLRSRESISSFIHKSLKSLEKANEFKILNAGSAGYSYGLNETNILHVDIAKKHLSHLTNVLIANVENLPLPDNQFDLIICVGSVLNYCDPILVMREFSRVLKKNGYIIIEFESSRTFELLFKKGFNQNVLFVETFFNAHDEKESIWYFSEDYIQQLIKSYKFLVIDIKRIHILSPLIYRIIKNSNFSSFFYKFDNILKFIPGINKFSSNVIYLIKTVE